jgi:methyl-accepting chemotaxis protein
LVVLGGPVAMGLLLWRMLPGVWRPVHEAEQLTERIAQGDLSADSDWHIRDGFGRTLDAIRSMRDRPRGLVTQVKVASGEILRAADEIALGNQDLERAQRACGRTPAGAVEL